MKPPADRVQCSTFGASARIPSPARAALARRGAAEALDELLASSTQRRRELLPEVEERRARQNRASERDRRGQARRRATPSP